MPENHHAYLEWNGERFCKLAEQIETGTFKVCDVILPSQKIEQQSYRNCMGLLKLADRYSAKRLEVACQKALPYTASPSYKNIKKTLQPGRISQK